MLRARKAGTDDLSQKVAEIATRLKDQLGIPGEVRTDVPLGEDGLGLDSMGRLDLYAAVEQECGVTIPEKYWGPRQVKSIDDLARVAVRKG